MLTLLIYLHIYKLQLQISHTHVLFPRQRRGAPACSFKNTCLLEVQANLTPIASPHTYSSPLLSVL